VNLRHSRDDSAINIVIGISVRISIVFLEQLEISDMKNKELDGLFQTS